MAATKAEPMAATKLSIPRIDQPRSSEENLFTPLELLNECRNFLKHRGDSNQKSNANSNVSEMLLSNATLNLIEKQEVLPNNEPLPSVKKEGPSLKQEEPSVKKEEDSGYVYPEIDDSSKKSQVVSSTQKEDNFNYTHFETFANSNDKKMPIFTSKITSVPLKHTFHGLTEEKLPQNFSIEDFLDILMEATEMNPFITVKAFADVLAHHDNSEALKTIFASQLAKGRSEELCLPDLGDAVNQKFNEDHDAYPHEDRNINGVYDLLDIDQKGFVCREDVSAFLSQIEEAEVDNLEEVSEQLWRLFEGADFSNQHRLTYWHFYLVKSSEEFERVSQLLSEFEFEIERND